MTNSTKLLLVVALFTPACGAKPEAAAAKAESTAAATASAEAPAPPATTAADPGAINVSPFGVPECDKYVKNFTACIESKVTGPDKATLLEGFEANRTKWRALATMREGAVALSLACRAANQKSKEELSVEYGCEF